jgi:hypothetical protein
MTAPPTGIMPILLEPLLHRLASSNHGVPARGCDRSEVRADRSKHTLDIALMQRPDLDPDHPRWYSLAF